MSGGAKKPVKPVMPPGRRWKWADGLMHDTPQPGDDDLVIPAEPGWTPPPSVTGLPKALQHQELSPVPDGFLHTGRTLLRVQALEFALRGSSVLNARPANGAEILREAEQIERWICAADAKSLSGKEP